MICIANETISTFYRVRSGFSGLETYCNKLSDTLHTFTFSNTRILFISFVFNIYRKEKMKHGDNWLLQNTLLKKYLLNTDCQNITRHYQQLTVSFH